MPTPRGTPRRVRQPGAARSADDSWPEHIPKSARLARARERGQRRCVITITGSTGTIGSELLHLLSGAGVEVRAVHRDVRKTRTWPNVTWVRADLDDERRLGVVHAAERLGVDHVVKLSALGASDHSKSTIAREHWEVEQALVNSRLKWTILRPHAFMQNWLADVA